MNEIVDLLEPNEFSFFFLTTERTENFKIGKRHRFKEETQLKRPKVTKYWNFSKSEYTTHYFE